MSSDQQAFLTAVRELSQSGQSKLAAGVLRLWTTGYPRTRDGYQAALRDAFELTDKLAADQPTGDSILSAVPELERSPLRDQLAPLRQPARSHGVLHQAGVLGQLWPGSIAGVDTRPGVLSSMLVLSLLGGGLGNLAGRGINAIRGEDDDHRQRRLTRTLTLAGGAAGLLPGAFYGAVNRYMGKPFFSSHSLPKKLSQEAPVHNARQVIPVDRLNQLLWNDPYVADRVPPAVAAGISGAVAGASRIGRPLDPAPFVTPLDLAQIAMGAGGGYLGGAAAGKLLSGLFGISDRSQQVLRRTGLMAGLINQAVPLIYGK